MATALPAASEWTGSTVTEGQFKAAQNDLRAYLAGLLGEDGLVATALATLGSAFAGIMSVSVNTTLTTADRGKVINVTSGTITITLPAAASAGAGFCVIVRNSGTGTVTLDGNLTETIDGSETVALKQYDQAVLVCDGTGWITLGLLVGTQAAGNNGHRIASTAFVQQAIGAIQQTQVSILTGSVANGSYIPLPSGYTQAQCQWMVSVQEAWDTPFDGVRAWTDSNRLVRSGYYNASFGVWYSVNADYIIIGVK